MRRLPHNMMDKIVVMIGAYLQSFGERNINDYNII